jgi:drug/metabolite transporter (DMT)-like permease
MTLINSTMMPQIVVLSVIFLGEFPEFLDWIGIAILAFSVTAVQYLQTKRTENRKSNIQKG